MKNKQTKGLSLSANPRHLNKGTFFAATKVFTEFFDKFKVFGNNTYRTKLAGGTKPALLAPVILGLVPRIFWQQLTNLVNQFAILFKKSMFTQDSRHKAWNDGYRGRWFGVCCKFYKRMYHSASSANELALNAKDDFSGWYFKRLIDYCCKFVKYPSPDTNVSTSPAGGEVLNSVFHASTLNVILRRYSLPEVPRRRIHNVNANAMSMFNNTPHSALSRHSLPQGAREENSVAFGNKVMDTRLPLPVGSGDKYDVSCFNFKRLLNVCCQSVRYPSPEAYASTSPSRGEVSQGRSMIEMLGVLAIIGVLSVGGIAGYSKAMQKWEDNKQIQQLGELFYNSINLQDSLFQEYQKKPGTTYSNGINILEAIGQIPNDMKRNGLALYDRYGNSFLFAYGVSTCRQSDGSLALCNYTFGTIYSIKLKQNGNKFNLNSERQCRNILKVAAAFDNEVSYIESRNKDNNINGYKISNVIYGKTRCVKDALCFSNLKPIDAANFCKSCSTETCEFILSFVGVK